MLLQDVAWVSFSFIYKLQILKSLFYFVLFPRFAQATLMFLMTIIGLGVLITFKLRLIANVTTD